jgi:hypothetical protein
MKSFTTFITEISKKTTKSYIQKSSVDMAMQGIGIHDSATKMDDERLKKHTRKFNNRHKGISQALKKL